MHLLRQQQIQAMESGNQQLRLPSCHLFFLCPAKVPELNDTVLAPSLVQGVSLQPELGSCHCDGTLLTSCSLCTKLLL